MGEVRYAKLQTNQKNANKSSLPKRWKMQDTKKKIKI